MMLDLFTTEQVLTGTVPILNDFGLLPEFYALEQLCGTHGVNSVILTWTKILTLGYGQMPSSRSSYILNLILSFFLEVL